MLILRSRKSVTGRNLAKLAGCKCSSSYIGRDDFIINYGASYRNANLNANVEFNKIRVSKILQNAGVSTPRIFLRGENIPEECFPLLARKKYHSQGRDVKYIHNRLELNSLRGDYDYLIQYIDKKSEYRVHVLGDYNIMVSVKIPINEYSDPIVRAKRNGWKQVTYDRDYESTLIDLGKGAIKALHYDFGAVDIIRKGNKLYVLEINAAPGLEPRKLQQYVEYFRHEQRKIL